MADLTYQGLLLDKAGHTKLNLSNGEAVIYSPYGSGKAFVLSGVALKVYKLLESGLTVEEIINTAQSPEWEETVQAVIAYFTDRGLFADKRKTKTFSAAKKPKSIALWIHVTDTCNLRCDYCYVHKGKRRLSKEACDVIVSALKADTETFQIKEVELKFAGGEPLVDIEIVSYFMDQARAALLPLGVKIHLAIITNGTLVTDEKAKFLKNEAFSVMVSLDGLGDFNNARKYADGRTSVHQVLEGIECLLNAGVRPTILTTVSDTNVEGLWDLMIYVREKGLTLSLSPSRDYEQELGLKMNVEHISNEMVVFLHKVCLLPDSDLPRLSFNGIQFTGGRTHICGGGSNYFAVDPDAGVCFCQMTVDKPMGLVTDKDSILSFATSQDTILEGGECLTCIWKNVCCGGCAVLAMNAGTFGKPSVMCDLMNAYLERSWYSCSRFSKPS
ncbi:MAG: Radical SAM domain-containing protein [candidate division WWE3 bacterium GW2011_GWA1_42_12]|nr:MAG: Radical SAM domain-containing protein [candidate division WWE3 bacterium GW2011_GWA1_42_12]